MKLIKKCPKCNRINEVNADRCISCAANLIMIPPVELTETTNTIHRYLICPVCGEKNHLKEGQKAGDIKFCMTCEQDDIRNLNEDDIRFESDDNNQICTDSKRYSQSASSDNRHLTTLTLKDINNVCISMTDGIYSVGKAGDVETQYFKNFRYVSRIHSHIKIDYGVVEIMDVSTNGTFINDRKINKDEWVKIQSGDMIRFADAPFEVNIC